jgi:hypothetical protein
VSSGGKSKKIDGYIQSCRSLKLFELCAAETQTLIELLLFAMTSSAEMLHLLVK